MLKIKQLTHFSLILLIAASLFAPVKNLRAQDDMPVSDDEIIVPPSGSTAPVIDDSDATMDPAIVDDYES
ncbi:MAG: hypothetical protein WC635_15285 [Bacteriovorax sp.]